MESQSSLKLSLDLSPPWLGGHQNKEPDKSSDLHDYICRLEAELRKIEAFKRELPLSVLLLTEAIGRLKKEVVGDGKDARAACNVDEIPSAGSENGEDGDKKSWMSSAQLWSCDQTASSLQPNLSKPRDGEGRQACEFRDRAGALSSLNDGPELSPANVTADCNKLVLTRPGLCLVTSESAGLKKGGVGRSGRPNSDPVVTDQLKLRYQSLPDHSPAMHGPRKQRRCWSPELHRRFIEALERLGGPQVATPKQIRELMQVNGLTNDEVKSHLQKYRLHIRKHPNTVTSLSRDKLFLTQDSQLEGSGGGSSSCLVNGAASLKAEANQSPSQEGSLHFAIRSANCNSPTSRHDSMEDDYEEKSDSHSWEGD